MIGNTAAKFRLAPLNVLQNRAIKNIFKVHLLTLTADIFQETSFLSISQLSDMIELLPPFDSQYCLVTALPILL